MSAKQSHHRHRRPARSRGGYVAVYAAMGLAVLAKGPVGVVLPAESSACFCFAALSKTRLRPSKTMPPHLGIASLRQVTQTLTIRRILGVVRFFRPLTAIGVIAIVALPWYVTVGIKTDGAWLVGFLGKHNVQRFTGAMEGHSGPVVYYLIAVLIGFFPWSCLMPIGVYRLVRRLALGTSNADRNADTFVACWAGLYIGFFSLSTKLPEPYVLPAYPVLAPLTGKLIDEWLRSPSLVPKLWFRLAIYMPAVVGVALAIGLPIMASHLLPGEQWLGVLGVSLMARSRR